MATRRKYKKKPTSFITAVQLDLDTEGFVYNKWGGQQVCKRGDWLIDKAGDKYMVSQESFAKSYEQVSPGVYTKSAPVWTEIANQPGKVKTNEGETGSEAGDYLVSNNPDGSDADAIAAANFQELYNIAED